VEPPADPAPTGPSRRPRGRATAVTAALLAGGALLAACGSGSPTVASTAVTTPTTAAPGGGASSLRIEPPPTGTVGLTESGSPVLYPLFNLWIPKYHTQYPGISIVTSATGSGAGATAAMSGQVDIGASDSYLLPAQRQQNPDALNIPLVVSSLVVVYRVPGVRGHLSLTGKVLSAIYRGAVTRWDAAPIASLNPGVKLPDVPIVTVHRSDDSGETFVFTQFLSKTDPVWRNRFSFGTQVSWPSAAEQVAAGSADESLQDCERTVGCVAYLATSYLDRAVNAGLGEAAVQNEQGSFELPTAAAVSAVADGMASRTPATGTISLVDAPVAGGYPIVNYEYAIVVANQTDPTAAQAIRSFLEWSIDPADGNAPGLLSTLSFVPLPASVVTQSAAQVNRVR